MQESPHTCDDKYKVYMSKSDMPPGEKFFYFRYEGNYYPIEAEAQTKGEPKLVVRPQEAEPNKTVAVQCLWRTGGHV